MDMEGIQLEQIAESMTQELRKQRVINSRSCIRITDVVKVPDNYQHISHDRKRKAIYTACVGDVLAITTVYEDGKIRTRVTGVSHRWRCPQ